MCHRKHYSQTFETLRERRWILSENDYNLDQRQERSEIALFARDALLFAFTTHLLTTAIRD